MRISGSLGFLDFRVRLLLLLSAANAFASPEISPRFELVPAYPNLSFDDNASAATVIPDGSGRVAVGLQRGQIRLLPEDHEATDAPMFLDLRDKLRDETEFEEGLHGIAFHPDFKANGRFYVCYTQRGPRRTVLSEFIAQGQTVDRRSERVLLEYPHPLANHWGGGIAFGADGYLYLGIGDGGLRDDPYRLGQNLWSLHGKVLRLDVDRRSEGLAYGIPADNPFVDRQEVRPEIWAIGFRNPWGMSFDRKTGTLWCGDVGQERWEEVNLIKRGANYGWSEMEGPERLAARTVSSEDEASFVKPIHTYGRESGISITGGFVYRGSRLPSLEGQYLFGDWGVGRVWSLKWDRHQESAEAPGLLYERPADGDGFNPTVIVPDADGEPLLFSHYPSMIYTLKEPERLASTVPDDEVIDEVIPEPEGDPIPPAEPVDDPDTSSSQGMVTERMLA